MFLREYIRVTPAIVYVFIGITLLATIGAGWAVFVQPYFLSQERKNVTHSHQYIEGKRAMLLKYAQEFTDNQAEIDRLTVANQNGKLDQVIAGMENQQIMLRIRIRDEMSNLPDEEIPPSVKRVTR